MSDFDVEELYRICDAGCAAEERDGRARSRCCSRTRTRTRSRSRSASPSPVRRISAPSAPARGREPAAIERNDALEIVRAMPGSRAMTDWRELRRCMPQIAAACRERKSPSAECFKLALAYRLVSAALLGAKMVRAALPVSWVERGRGGGRRPTGEGRRVCAWLDRHRHEWEIVVGATDGQCELTVDAVPR